MSIHTRSLPSSPNPPTKLLKSAEPSASGMEMRYHRKLPRGGHYFWRTKGGTELFVQAFGAAAESDGVPWLAEGLSLPSPCDCTCSQLGCCFDMHVTQREQPNTVFLSHRSCLAASPWSWDGRRVSELITALSSQLTEREELW